MKFNTHLQKVKGMVAYNGQLTQDNEFMLRITSDIHETLSIEYANIMLIVDYADVLKLVEKARKAYKEKTQ